MLCSFSKKFIYLKTIKTAGTSVEIFFERYCRSPLDYTERHFVDEAVDSFGIVGCRGPVADRSLVRFYNHMSAQEALDRLGKDIWESYFKFCVIRNPYDKVVSMFWYSLTNEERIFLSDAPFSKVREKFSDFVANKSNYPNDRKVYTINGEIVVDYLIRFENLGADMSYVCELMDIDFHAEKMGRFKGDKRLRNEHFSEYYDGETKKSVSDFYKFEFINFAYEI